MRRLQEKVEVSMKVTQEKLPDSQIGLEIEISADISQKTYEKIVRNLARTANIPGFRKGKVPRQILLQRLGTNYVKAATVEELIQDNLDAAIKQESITSLGNPKLRSNFEELVQQFSPGNPLTFSASVDVPPSVELGDYKTISVTAEETAYEAEKVDEWLKQRQEQQATLVPIEDRPAQMGDVAIIDYEGRYAEQESEEPISGVQGTDFKVEMEAGRLIEGMVEGMVGMQPEETKELTVTFPEDYPQEELAGKPVIFKVTLKELKEKELPELDDDFAEEVSKFETIAELRESLEKQFQEQAENATKDSIYNAIKAELVNISTVDLPDTLVQEEINRVLTQTAIQMEQMGVDVRQLFTSDNIPQMRENARPEAVNRLKEALVLSEIAKTEALEPDEEAIAERIAELQEQLKDQEIDQDRLKEVVEDELRDEKVLEWLKEQITVELVPQGTLSASDAEESAQTETDAATATVDVEATSSESEEE